MSGNEADLVFAGGKIRTPAHPSGFVQALAVRDGLIQALGTDDEIRELTGRRTRVIDLRGRLALPAFGDAHVHAVAGGLESLRCNLLGLRTRHECLAAVDDYCSARPAGAWVLGGGWSMSAFPGGVPTAADLDPVTGGRPAFLPNRDHHSAWVNTTALTIAGIDASTPDPIDGRIERDDDGRPTGALHDGAMRLVAAHVPPPDPAELIAGLLAGQAHLHSLGITRFQDACVGAAGELGIPDAFDAYLMAADYGMLSSQVVGALWWDRRRGLEQLEDLLARREQAGGGQGGTRQASGGQASGQEGGGQESGGRFRATTVKLMLDGVCETFTAAMSAPYLDRDGHPGGHRGRLFLEPEALGAAIRQLAAAGFQLHFHAIGDHAVSTALDALAALPAAQRQAGRHHLAHLQFISPRDMGRFRALDAVANFQPLWACAETQMEELTIPFVGAERAAWQYQIGSLVRGGTRIAFGSDWPVSSADPLQEIHVAVNRVLSERLGRAGKPECENPFLPDQAITLDAAIDAFTAGVAWVNHEEDVAGQLRPGMRADLAVLDQDLYAIPARDIGSTSVVTTVAGGVVVHGDR
ncbi:MAG TPA: amidohydrolase [Streptosporangiaceae bacterium]|nr:amidohydrolase [Streptosporangiaceae bacterium]